MTAAKRTGLRVGSARDTFLGGAHQTVRKLVDAGLLGTPVGGTAYFMCPGHERWHPNPAFYYDIGGGPMLDMGPYYITDLVNLLGPVASVAGFATTPQATRTITAKERYGEVIPVHVPTHVTGVLRFANGAVVQMTLSFDVAGHKHVPIEIYGTAATLIVPDPNHFGGQIEKLEKGGEWTKVDTDMPYDDGNFRSIGLADMALAIRANRPHRANGDLALHVLEVMEAFGKGLRLRRNDQHDDDGRAAGAAQRFAGRWPPRLTRLAGRRWMWQALVINGVTMPVAWAAAAKAGVRLARPCRQRFPVPDADAASRQELGGAPDGQVGGCSCPRPDPSRQRGPGSGRQDRARQSQLRQCTVGSARVWRSAADSPAMRRSSSRVNSRPAA